MLEPAETFSLLVQFARIIFCTGDLPAAIFHASYWLSVYLTGLWMPAEDILPESDFIKKLFNYYIFIIFF